MNKHVSVPARTKVKRVYAKVDTADKAATFEDYRDLQFEPWQEALGKLPTTSEWGTTTKPHMDIILVALGCMYKAKPELIEIARSFSDAGSALPLLASFGETREFLKQFYTLLESAEVRMHSALANLEGAR